MVDMRIPRITIVASITAVGAWSAKATTIGVAGGFGKSPLEAPLFILGLIAFLLALTSLGWAFAVGRPAVIRTFAAGAAVLAAMATSAIVASLVSAFITSEHWAWGEVNLWVPALGLLAFVVIRDGGTGQVTKPLR